MFKVSLLLDYLISQIKLRSSKIIWPSIVLLTIIYIYVPFSDPTITINPTARLFELELPKTFKECELVFKSKVIITQYRINLITKTMTKKSKPHRFEDPKQEVTKLKIENLMLGESENLDDSEETSLMVKVYFESSLPLKISAVSVDQEVKHLETFYANNVRSPSKNLEKRNKIRRYISNIILKFNDEVSNLVLTMLFLFLIYLILLMGGKLILIKANNFNFYVKWKYKIKSKEMLNNSLIAFGEKHGKDNESFKFYQIVGPAIGFVLTISSLIAGLHPLVKEAQNLIMFLDAIQVALVSTFLGLLIRIVAISLQRIDNKLFIQTDEIFFKIEEDLNDSK